MKKVYTFIFSLALLLLSYTAQAQLFGQDVKISPGDTLSQDEVQIDVAFNGWIFALHNINDSVSGGLSLRKSTDNGATWTTIDRYSPTATDYPQFDLVVAGTDTNNLRVYVAAVNHNTASGTYTLFVDRYDGNNGVFIGSNLNYTTGTRKIYDVALATDYKFPAIGASPYSVGLLYSTYSSSQDSVNFYCSVDGGNNFLPSVNVYSTGYYCRNVGLAYGRGASGSNGRYFFVWERLSASNSNTGNIFTSRNLSTVDGPISAFVNLDSISNTMINLCKNPRIAVQYNNLDNDSAATTAIVTVDRDYSTTGTDYDLLGFYNKRAHYQDHWYRFDVVNTSENDMQSDVSYDPVNNNFLLTYLDSTNQKIPYVVHDYNMNSPSTWTLISTNYVNHTAELRHAFPKVVINPALTQVALAWIKSENGNNVAYFDAEYSTIVPKTSQVLDTICPGDSVLFNGVYYNSPVADVPGDTSAAFNGVDSFALFTLLMDTTPVPVIGVAGNVLSTDVYNAYQWQLSNVDITGANAQSFTAPSSGSYSVVVTDGNGCVGESAPLNVTVVSVNNSTGNMGMKVYPNPVTDNLYFDLGGLNSADILLTDIQGKVVRNEKVDNYQSVFVNDLPAGTYMLKVTSGSQTGMLQILKQ